MSRLALVFIPVLMSGAVFAQRATLPSHYGSPSGFGSVLFPGTGHAPVTIPGAIGNPRFPAQLSTAIRGYPVRDYSGRGAGYRRSFPGRGYNSAPVVLPYPVFMGGYGYGVDYGYGAPPPDAYAPPQVVQSQPVTPPIVIINQGYKPETANPVVRDYSNQEPPAESSGITTYTAPVHPFPDPNEPKQETAARPPDQAPTIYLIAFKDHTILPALAYWVEGDTLNYVTENGVPNRASLALIDKDFSKQLNSERSVEFNLP